MQEIQHALSEPFAPDDVHWKPQVVTGNRALGIAYIDARAVMDRLDAAAGVGGWQDSYDPLPDGTVVCRLRVKIGKAWITKTDVGSPSDQKDEGDRRKAAFSDALKRVAVKFGIGRYLYNLEAVWCDYDPKSKQLVKKPPLPPWALPRSADTRHPTPDTRSALPASGKELLTRLVKHEQKLVSEGRCLPGALLRHVLEAGQRAGYPANLEQWSGPAMLLAAEEARRFGEEHKAG
jgi:hypothetical protein